MTSNNCRDTIFTSSNPYKEANPAKHIEKRSINNIIKSCKEQSSSVQDNNILNYCYYEKENVLQSNNYQGQKRQKSGKRVFQDKLTENYGNNIIVLPETISISSKSKKAQGIYSRGNNNIESTSSNNQSQQRKMYDFNTNRETITLEMQNQRHQVSAPTYNELSKGSQRKQIIKPTSIQDCFNYFDKTVSSSIQKMGNDISEKANHRQSSQNQPSSLLKVEKRVNRSNTLTNTTTAQDSYAQNYNRSTSSYSNNNNYNSINQPIRTNAIFQHGTSTRTKQSFYL